LDPLTIRRSPSLGKATPSDPAPRLTAILVSPIKVFASPVARELEFPRQIETPEPRLGGPPFPTLPWKNLLVNLEHLQTLSDQRLRKGGYSGTIVASEPKLLVFIAPVIVLNELALLPV